MSVNIIAARVLIWLFAIVRKRIKLRSEDRDILLCFDENVKARTYPIVDGQMEGEVLRCTGDFDEEGRSRFMTLSSIGSFVDIVTAF